MIFSISLTCVFEDLGNAIRKTMLRTEGTCGGQYNQDYISHSAIQYHIFTDLAATGKISFFSFLFFFLFFPPDFSLILVQLNNPSYIIKAVF